ncbi:MAG: metabolite traffic protein EboE [Phycisphaeraceae bacterium]
MQHALGQGTHLGYCTNVHAGPTHTETLANLQRHAVAVKQRVSPDAPMGLGLWLSAQAAQQILAEGRTVELRDWLDERGLYVFTLNGFPYGNFHDTTVKHRVYRPDWTEAARFDYTLQLVRILAELLPEEGEGSISTLPIGWRTDVADEDANVAAARLTDLVHRLARIELDTGKLIHLDLEPEPGCVLDTSEGVVRFFEDHLLGTADELSVRSYLRVCHDVCHAAVMFEAQRDALDRYRRAGLSVGKVQLSSALRIALDAMNEAQRQGALNELAQFAEGRYLHQTTVRHADGRIDFHDDLPAALAAGYAQGEWRVHFHVPIHLERIGVLATTREHVHEALAVTLQDEVRHFEVETYAWHVLPEALQRDELADGLAEELAWVRAAGVTVGD